MAHYSLYLDKRELFSCCTFCGREADTRDHCPSRVLLDEPYPENLPVVPACSECNSKFSNDEEYLACLISCVLVGSTDPTIMPREKTKQILSKKTILRARIEQSRIESGGNIMFNSESNRISNILIKLAQGHVLYELNTLCMRSPDEVAFRPLPLMLDNEREQFEILPIPNLLPEVGSRAMQRLVDPVLEDRNITSWIAVQPKLYRYLVSFTSEKIEVRIVINEYLAGYIRWDEQESSFMTLSNDYSHDPT